jgi:hypothetical protein
MAEARKTVTIVFPGVAGSTSLGDRLDPEASAASWSATSSRCDQVEKFIEDAVTAVFRIRAARG